MMYGSARILGKMLPPNISIGMAPARSERSSSTACAVPARLLTHNTRSRPSVRVNDRTRWLAGFWNSIEPRPKTAVERRTSMSRRVQFSSDVAFRCCDSTLTA